MDYTTTAPDVIPFFLSTREGAKDVSWMNGGSLDHWHGQQVRVGAWRVHKHTSKEEREGGRRERGGGEREGEERERGRREREREERVRRERAR